MPFSVTRRYKNDVPIKYPNKARRNIPTNVRTGTSSYVLINIPIDLKCVDPYDAPRNIPIYKSN